MKTKLFVLLAVLTSTSAFCEEIHLSDVQFSAISKMTTETLKAPASAVTKIIGYNPRDARKCTITITRNPNDQILVGIDTQQHFANFLIARARPLVGAAVSAPDFVSLIESIGPSSRVLQMQSTSERGVMAMAIVEQEASSSFTECSFKL